MQWGNKGVDVAYEIVLHPKTSLNFPGQYWLASLAETLSKVATEFLLNRIFY